MENWTQEEHDDIKIKTIERAMSGLRQKLIILAALICVATFAALGALTWWHAGLISRGETSIEAHINNSEKQKFKVLGHKYTNPYDLGPRENWRLFLGLNDRYLHYFDKNINYVAVNMGIYHTSLFMMNEKY